MDLTVIIAVKNAEDKITNALDSIKNADSNKGVKVIVVNDGSTDNTQNILEEYEMENLKVINLEKNIRPGGARNLAIKECDTKYFTILDADDEFRKNIFLDLIPHIKKDYDIIKFNYMYKNKDRVFFEKYNQNFNSKLYDKDIEKLALDNYYSVSRVYRTDFIKENNIKYTEKIYYEDINFVIGAYTKAKKALVIPNVLLQININQNSATREKFNDDFHIYSINEAIKEVFTNNEFRDINIKYNTWEILANKSLYYLRNRCSESYQEQSSIYLIKTLKKYLPNKEVLKTLELTRGFNEIDLIRHDLIDKISDFRKEDLKVNSKINNIILNIPKSNAVLKRIYKENTNYYLVNYFDSFYKGKEYKDIILYLGFDFEYRGNSKYKFLEDLKQGKKVYFVTKDKSTNQKYRITPYSKEYYLALSQAKEVYLESFTDLKFRVGKDTIIKQLWHGTPIKKMFLDSTEKYFNKKNPFRRELKIKSLSIIDEFFAYNDFEEKKIYSAFNIKPEKIVRQKSSRINYLKNNKNNIEFLKDYHHIPKDKKVILYAPTWRDYSFERKEKYGIDKKFFELLRKEKKEETFNSLYKELVIKKDYNRYLKELNFDKMPTKEELLKISDYYYDIFSDEFIEKLGYKNGNYFVIGKIHTFGEEEDNVGKYVNTSLNLETQDMILISDICISDYSSIIFDFLEIDKKVYLLWDDINLFEEYRGVYEECKEDLKPLVSYTQKELYRKIIEENKIEINNKYLNI